jgi:WD40 repeat protein
LYGTYTGHSESVYSFISISNTVMLSGSGDGQMRQWTLSSGTFSATDVVYTTAGSSVFSICYIPSLNTIAAGLNNGYIELKIKGSNAVTGNLYQYTSNGVTYGHTPGYSINDLAVISDSNGLIASAGNDFKVIIWDVANLLVKYTLTGHAASVNGLRFLSSSNYLASTSIDKTTRLWDTSSGTFVRSFSSSYDIYQSLEFLSPSILMVGSLDTSVKTFSVSSGSTLLTGNTVGLIKCSVLIPGETIFL